MHKAFSIASSPYLKGMRDGLNLGVRGRVGTGREEFRLVRNLKKKKRILVQNDHFWMFSEAKEFMVVMQRGRGWGLQWGKKWSPSHLSYKQRS